MINQKNKTWISLSPDKIETILSNFIEIELLQPFSVVRETLGRIGVLTENVLCQSCHILHKKDRYYIGHFNQFFELDGKSVITTDLNILMLKKVMSLLVKWNLVLLRDVESLDISFEELSQVFVDVIPSKDKKFYQFQKKYDI